MAKKSITATVKTLEDACKIVGVNPKTLRSAFDKLEVIIKALNEGWKPDWTNWDEYKYYPWFDMSAGKDRKGFELVDCVRYSRSVSDVSSRLCFKTEALAKYAAKQFKDLYKEFFTL